MGGESGVDGWNQKNHFPTLAGNNNLIITKPG